MMGTLNNANGTIQPTTPPANDVIYVDPNANEYVTNSAVIINPDNTTTTANVNNTTTTTTQSGSQSNADNTTTPATTVAPTETTTINTFEDGDYLANIQDVLFNTQDETKAREKVWAQSLKKWLNFRGSYIESKRAQWYPVLE